MKNILVFPCGSEIGLEIYRSFRGIKNIKLFGGSSVSDHGRFVYENYIQNIPYIENKNFINKLNKIIKKHKIDYVFPAHDSVILKLAQNIKKINCEIISPPLATCEICRSKKKTYEIFKKIIKTPKIYKKTDLKIIKYPVFLKPDVGQGSKGVYIANNEKDVLFYQKKDPSLLILEYLPGNEFTIDCFTNFEGKLMFAGARQRNRISNGISVNTSEISGKEFQRLAKIINNKLKLNGAWFFQVKKDKNKKLTLLEIAPRIAGSMAINRVKGANLPVLSFYNHMKIPVQIKNNNFKIIMDRALNNSYKINIKYKHVYLDFDDCLLFNGKINENIIKFIFQCLNNKIKIHLISKHQYNLKNKLEELKIKQLFDTITHLEQTDEKYKYIKYKNSIFIDDSFSERKKIIEKLKIPVFSSDSIESLII